MSEKNSLKDKIKRIKIEYVILALSALVIVLVVVSFFSGDEQSTQNQSVDEYVAMLETKLSKELSSVKDAGKVSVIISVSGGLSTVIATQKVYLNDSSGAFQENPLLVSGKPVLLGELYPEITGVVIVSQGADNLKVRVNLLNAAAVFLGIDRERIEIQTMK